MNYLRIGADVAPGSVDGLREMLQDTLKKERLEALLNRITVALWLYPQKLRAKIRDYLLPLKSRYLIIDFVHFEPGNSGYVTPQVALRKIDQVWDDADYPHWRAAPKNDALLVFIFIGLYADYKKNIPTWPAKLFAL